MGCYGTTGCCRTEPGAVITHAGHTAEYVTDPGPTWQKATASSTNACVEVAITPTEVLLRNSRMPAGPKLRFTHHEWDAFLAGVENGEFSLTNPETA